MIDRRLSGHSTREVSNAGPAYPELSLASARRRAYFEWRPEEIQAVAMSADALELAHGHHLSLFKEAGLRDTGANSHLCAKLCQGISRLEAFRCSRLREARGDKCLSKFPRARQRKLFFGWKSRWNASGWSQN